MKNIGMLSEMKTEAVWVMKYICRYRKIILLCCVFGIVGTLLGLAGSVVSKYLIDTVTGYRVESIPQIAFLMLSLAVGNILFGGVSKRIAIKAEIHIRHELQAEVYDHIMEADWEELHEYRSGDLLSRLNGDVNTVSSSILGWFTALLQNLVRFAGSLVIILYYDPTMAVIALLSSPVTMLVSRFLVKKMRHYNIRLREADSQMMTFWEDSFQNMQSIKAFDLIGSFQKNMRSVQNSWSSLMLEYNKVSIFSSGFLSLTGMLVSYLSLGWAAYRLWSGAIVFGTMTLFLQLASNLSGAFSSLVSLVPKAVSVLTSVGRIRKVMELKKEDILVDQAVEAVLEEGRKSGLSIRMQHLDFTYREGNGVLRDVSLEAEPGEIIALVGPSGEGKTTMIRILLGLLQTAKGTALLTAQSGKSCPVSAATRGAFSYVPQGNTIFAGTIAENLRMIKPEATEAEIVEALKTACAYEFIEKMPQGIHSPVQEKGVGLSEGQAQRIAIARAILKDAPVMLFDEATSALDVETEKEVLQNLVKGTRKKTCIVTAHRPGVIRMCSRIYSVEENGVTEIPTEQY